MRTYSVVILTAEGGVISRHAGTDFSEAKRKALLRREDFPTAQKITVVAPQGHAAFQC